MREVVQHFINGQILNGVNIPYTVNEEYGLFSEDILQAGYTQAVSFPLNEMTNEAFGFPYESSRDRVIPLKYEWMGQYSGKTYVGTFVATDVTEKSISGNIVLGDYEVIKNISEKTLNELDLGRIDIPKLDAGTAYGLYEWNGPAPNTTESYLQVQFMAEVDVTWQKWGFGIKLPATTTVATVIDAMVARINTRMPIEKFGNYGEPGMIVKWLKRDGSGNLTGEATWHMINEGGLTLTSPPFEYLLEYDALDYVSYSIGRYLKDGEDLYQVITHPLLVVINGVPQYPEITNTAIFQPIDRAKYWVQIAENEDELIAFMENPENRFFWVYNDHPRLTDRLEASRPNTYQMLLTDGATGVPYPVNPEIKVEFVDEGTWDLDEETYSTASLVEAYYRPILTFMENMRTFSPGETKVIFPMVYNPGFADAEDEEYSSGTVFDGFINYMDSGSTGYFGTRFRYPTLSKKFFFVPMVYTSVVIRALCKLMNLNPVGTFWEDLKDSALFEFSVRSHDMKSADEDPFLGRKWNWLNYIRIADCLPSISVVEYLKGLEKLFFTTIVIDFVRREMRMNYAADVLTQPTFADVTPKAIRLISRKLPEGGGFDLFYKPDTADQEYFDYERERVRLGKGKNSFQAPVAPVWNFAKPVNDLNATGGAVEVIVPKTDQPGISKGDDLAGSFSRRLLFYVGDSSTISEVCALESGSLSLRIQDNLNANNAKKWMEFLDGTSLEEWEINPDVLDLFTLKVADHLVIRSMKYLLGKVQISLPLKGSAKVGVYPMRENLFEEVLAPNIPRNRIVFMTTVMTEEDLGTVLGVTISNYTVSGLEVRFNTPGDVALAEDCFRANEEIQIVEMPDVVEIGVSAFRECVNLTLANLPNVTLIGDVAFAYCTSLETVFLTSATRLGGSCFQGCSTYEGGTFPACTQIQDSCFSDCTSLLSVIFPVCTSVGSEVFTNTSPEAIELPVCENFGPSTGSDNIFGSATVSGLTLTISAALATVRLGTDPDGDIQYVLDNGGTVVYV